MLEREIYQELLDLIHSELPFTDLLIVQDEPIMAKLPTGWHPMEAATMTRDDMRYIVERISPNWEEELPAKGAISGPYMLQNYRLRVNAYLTRASDKISVMIRRLPRVVPTLQATGLPVTTRVMAEAPRGLVLISGATGSGKSTSMAALVNIVNESRNAHILTIEDPIEYVFEPKRSIFSQREVGVDTPSYSDGVRDAMRQRPDVIMIGEIRDRETAENALLAGESGHLVFGTLHANSATGAIQKILSFFTSYEREAKVQTLGGSLIGIISQILIPKQDGTGYALASELLFNHRHTYSKMLGDIDRLQSHFDQRKARNNDTVSQSMGDSLIDLVQRGLISKPDAFRAATHIQSPALLEQLKNTPG